MRCLEVACASVGVFWLQSLKPHLFLFLMHVFYTLWLHHVTCKMEVALPSHPYSWQETGRPDGVFGLG